MGIFIFVEISWLREFKKKIIVQSRKFLYTYILQENLFILKNLISMKICVYVYFSTGKSLWKCKINSKISDLEIFFTKSNKALKFFSIK